MQFYPNILNPLQWETLANSILPLEFFFSFLAVALFNSKSVHFVFNSPLCGIPLVHIVQTAVNHFPHKIYCLTLQLYELLPILSSHVHTSSSKQVLKLVV